MPYLGIRNSKLAATASRTRRIPRTSRFRLTRTDSSGSLVDQVSCVRNEQFQTDTSSIGCFGFPQRSSRVTPNAFAILRRLSIRSDRLCPFKKLYRRLGDNPARSASIFVVRLWMRMKYQTFPFVMLSGRHFDISLSFLIVRTGRDTHVGTPQYVGALKSCTSWHCRKCGLVHGRILRNRSKSRAASGLSTDRNAALPVYSARGFAAVRSSPSSSGCRSSRRNRLTTASIGGASPRS